MDSATTTVAVANNAASSESPATTVVAEPAEPECELGDALDAVWLVETDSGHGTAFHIGDGEWITAAHVVGGAGEVILRYGAQDDAAVVVGADYDTDVALLQSTVESHVLAWASDVAVGDTVIAAGFPLYGESSASVTRGVVSRRERDIFLGEVVLTDTAVNPGNSGGPLLDECGDVAGMIVEKIVGVGVEGVGYAVAADEVVAQLPRLRDGYRTPPPSIADVHDAGASHEPLQSDWEIVWTEPDMMTGESTAFLNIYAINWEGDGVLGTPVLSIGCNPDWWLWWGGAFVLGDYEYGIYVEYRVGGGEIQSALWEHSNDNRNMFSGRWDPLETLDFGATRDLHGAFRDAPPDAQLTIRAWGYDNELIGTAVFPTGFHAEYDSFFTNEFCFPILAE